MGFELLGAFAAEDPMLDAKSTVDVIIADMPAGANSPKRSDAFG
jgi:hypothetical protein